MHYINCFFLIICVGGIINVQCKNTNATDLEEKINHKLYTLEMNLLDRVIAYVDGKENSMKKHIEEKVTEILSASNKNLEEEIQRLNSTLDAFKINLEEQITQRFNAMSLKFNKQETETQTLDGIKKELLKNISSQLPCKERSVHGHQNLSSYLLSTYTLNHGTLQRNSSGYLTRYKMHFAIKADPAFCIWLLDKADFEASETRYVICLGWNSEPKSCLAKNINYHSIFRDGYTEILNLDTPDILSATDFRAFYIKIDNGKLEFGKEDSFTTPIISHEDESFGLINYIHFRYVPRGWKIATIRYDCPDPFKY